MAIITFAHKFKPGFAVPKIKLFYQTDFFEQVHGSIDGCQIAPTFGQGCENLPVGQWMRMFLQNIQDCPARTGDFA